MRARLARVCQPARKPRRRPLLFGASAPMSSDSRPPPPREPPHPRFSSLPHAASSLDSSPHADLSVVLANRKVYQMQKQSVQAGGSGDETAAEGGTTLYGTDGNLTYGTSRQRGMRSALEDADFNSLGLPQSPAHALFAIFDGHAGVRAANCCSKHRLSCRRSPCWRGHACRQ